MRQAPKHEAIKKSGIGNRGSITVELALILPFLVFMFAGITDLGLVIREHQVVQNGAREGARFSALPHNRINLRPVDCNDCVGGCNQPGCKTQSQIEAEIKQRVIDYLANENITVTAGDVTVDQNYQIAVGAITVFASQVSVAYNRNLLIGVVPGIPSSLTMQGSAVFVNN